MHPQRRDEDEATRNNRLCGLCRVPCHCREPQLLALLGLSDKRPDWRLRWKQRPLPWAYATAMLAAQVGLEWLPYMEELIRTIRAAPKASS